MHYTSDTKIGPEKPAKMKVQKSDCRVLHCVCENDFFVFLSKSYITDIGSLGMVRRFQRIQRFRVELCNVDPPPQKHLWVHVAGGTRCRTQGFLSPRRIRDTLWGGQWDDRMIDGELKKLRGKIPKHLYKHEKTNENDARHSSKQFDLRQL